MAFDPNKYKGLKTSEKALPIILLLDVSGSMSGNKIDILYDAVNHMVDELNQQATQMERTFKVAIFTFGNTVNLHTPFTDAKDLVGNISRINASGGTPLGAVLDLAKDMIEDKSVTLGRWYRPAVVLVSDGYPTDSWEGNLDSFIHDGRSAKCQRFSLAIQADLTMLRKFASQSEFCLQAENAADILKAFQFVTMSVQNRAVSSNPNIFPGSNTQDSAGNVSSAQYQDDDEGLN